MWFEPLDLGAFVNDGDRNRGPDYRVAVDYGRPAVDHRFPHRTVSVAALRLRRHVA
jgi:hypothetical protein